LGPFVTTTVLSALCFPDIPAIKVFPRDSNRVYQSLFRKPVNKTKGLSPINSIRVLRGPVGSVVVATTCVCEEDVVGAAVATAEHWGALRRAQANPLRILSRASIRDPIRVTPQPSNPSNNCLNSLLFILLLSVITGTNNLFLERDVTYLIPMPRGRRPRETRRVSVEDRCQASLVLSTNLLALFSLTPSTFNHFSFEATNGNI